MPRPPRRRVVKHTAHHEHWDTYHNQNIPCCRLLETWTDHVLHYESSAASSSSLLVSFLRRHWQRKVTTQNEDDSPHFEALKLMTLAYIGNPEDTKQPDQLEAFLNFLSRNNEDDIQVPSSLVDNAIASIECEACRQQVQQCLLRQAQWPLRRLNEYSTSSLDSTEGYIAMEEGSLPSKDLVFKYVQNTGGISGWQLRRGESAWTVDDIDFLTREFLFLACLPPDRLQNVFVLEENTLLSIQKSVETRIEEHEHEMLQNLQDLERQTRKFYEMPKEEPNIDVKSFSILQEIDQALDDLFQRALRTLIQATRSYNNIASYLPDSVYELLTSRLQGAWNTYNDAQRQILAAVSNFEEQRFKLEDPPGSSMPQMFMSSTSRYLCRRLIQSKQECVFHTLNQTRNALDAVRGYDFWGRPRNTSMLRVLYTYEVFYQVVTGHHHRRNQLDYAFEDVFYALREWTETLYDVKIAKIMDQHSTRQAKFSRLLGTAISTAVLNGEDGEDSDDEDEDDLLDVAMAITEMPSFGKNFHQLKELREMVNDAMDGVLQTWMKLRRDELEGEDEDIAAMPTDLSQWMLNQKDPSNGSPCTGSEPEIRVSCIFFGLFLRWLSDRCNEWNSKIAEEELLKVMADEKSVDTKNGMTSKANKKKKKKKTASLNQDNSDGKTELEAIPKLNDIGANASVDTKVATTVAVVIPPEVNDEMSSTTSDSRPLSTTGAVDDDESGFIMATKSKRGKKKQSVPPGETNIVLDKTKSPMQLKGIPSIAETQLKKPSSLKQNLEVKSNRAQDGQETLASTQGKDLLPPLEHGHQDEQKSAACQSDDKATKSSISTPDGKPDESRRVSLDASKNQKDNGLSTALGDKVGVNTKRQSKNAKKTPSKTGKGVSMAQGSEKGVEVVIPSMEGSRVTTNPMKQNSFPLNGEKSGKDEDETMLMFRQQESFLEKEVDNSLTVGVYAGKTFDSAEDFLVSRLISLFDGSSGDDMTILYY